jgi:hypothetical protein
MYERQRYLLDGKIEAIGLTKHRHLFYLAGGAVTSVFSGRKINDLDLFFRTEEDLKALQKIIEGEGKERIYAEFVTKNAVSYRIKKELVQLVRCTFAQPRDMLGTFDFTICMASYNPRHHAENDFIFDPLFMPDLAARVLRYNPGPYPIASLWRMKKFLLRGFNLPAVESIKLALAINNLNLDTYEALKNQLEGIDTSFLKDVTDQLMNKGAETYDFHRAIDFMNEILSRIEEGGPE